MATATKKDQKSDNEGVSAPRFEGLKEENQALRNANEECQRALDRRDAALEKVRAALLELAERI
jgi:hypothetical protein